MSKEVLAQLEIRKDGQGRWNLFVLERSKLVNECVKTFLSEEATETIRLNVSVTEPKKKMTRSQQGYYHAEIKPKITRGFVDLGNYEMNDTITDRFLRCSFLGYDLVKIGVNEVIKEPWSFSDKRVDDGMRKEFIDKCIVFASQELHTFIETPDEYKLRKHFE